MKFFIRKTGSRHNQQTLIYILMNVIGGGLACFASYLIHYIPFIILEAVWTLVSLIALFKYYKSAKHKI